MNGVKQMNDKVSFVFWKNHSGGSPQNVLDSGNTVSRATTEVADEVIQVEGDADLRRVTEWVKEKGQTQEIERKKYRQDLMIIWKVKGKARLIVLGNWEEGGGIPRNRDTGEGLCLGVMEGSRYA